MRVENKVAVPPQLRVLACGSAVSAFMSIIPMDNLPGLPEKKLVAHIQESTMRYRIRLAMTMLILIAACPSFAVTQNEAEDVVTNRYRLTTPAFLGGFKDIGTVLTARREGLRVNRAGKAFKPNVVKNHRIVAAGGGDLPLSGVHDGALKPGERLHLYSIRTGDDFVQLDLYTVVTYVVSGSGTRGPTPLQASIRFHYDDGLAGVSTRQLLEDINEWLADEGGPRPIAVEPIPDAGPRPAGKVTSTIRLGQTQDEVSDILGPPEKLILLGAKTIFVYRDLKVVFVDGKVSDAY